MVDKKFILFTVIVIAALLIGGVLLLSKTDPGRVASMTTSNPDINVQVVTEETSYDWGQIGIDDGKVEKIFEIRNDGTDTLRLSNVVTSCMCTSAQLMRGDDVSPTFGMHSKSGYVMEVPSGEVAELKVIFDPAFHGPSGVGPINRQVNVATNDPDKPELSFMLTAIVRR